MLQPDRKSPVCYALQWVINLAYYSGGVVPVKFTSVKFVAML